MSALVATLSVSVMHRQLKEVKVHPILKVDQLQEPLQNLLSSEHADKNAEPASGEAIFTQLLAPMDVYVFASEQLLRHIIAPPMSSHDGSFAEDASESDRLVSSVGEAVMQLLRQSVPMKLSRLPGGGPTNTENSTALFFEYQDALRYLNNELLSDDNGKLHQLAQTAKVTFPEEVYEEAGEDEGMRLLRWLKAHRFVKIYPKSWEASFSQSQSLIRFLDPWEAVPIEGGLAAAQSTMFNVGRQTLKPVELFSADDTFKAAAAMMSSIRSEMSGASKFRRTSKKSFHSLWRALRGEAWVVSAISAATDQAEGVGADHQERVSSAFHWTLSQHLYRNFLFRRLLLPHQFIGTVKVDMFGLKDISPHRYFGGPLEIYGVVRLIREHEYALHATSNKSLDKNFHNSSTTKLRRIEAGKASIVHTTLLCNDVIASFSKSRGKCY